MSGLIAWWNARTQREHLLLGLMLALFAVIFAIYGVTKPLLAARANAEARLERAIQSDRIISRGVAALKSVAANPPSQASDLPLAQLVEQSARDTGFQPTPADTLGDGRVAVSIPAARARALFAWLAALEAQGVFVEQAQLTTKSDGSLTVALNLRRRTS